MYDWYSSPRPTLFRPTRSTGWVLLILGVLAVVAGIAAIVWPGLTLINLIFIFGWFAIITGALEIIHAFTAPTTGEGKALLGLRGLITLGLGIAALVIPGVTLGAVVLLLAAYFFVTGVMQIIAAFRGHVHFWMLIWGILGVIAGIVAVVYPNAAALSLALIFGIYAILAGITSISSGWHILHNSKRTPTATSSWQSRAS